LKKSSKKTFGPAGCGTGGANAPSEQKFFASFFQKRSAFFLMTLAETMASTPEMREIFCARGSVQAMLDVEAALAKAGAATGLLSAEAAAAIGGAAQADDIGIEALAADGALAGTVVIPLVKWLRGVVPAHAKAVHIGATSQDIIDTGLMLQLRGGVALLDAELAVMAHGATELTERYAATPMLGRTLLQAAMPTTFGLKAANWLLAIRDSRRAIQHAAGESIFLQCGGAAGTLDALGGKAAAFADAFGRALDLPVPALAWHSSRAPLARLAAAIAGAVGVAGKIGTDIALLMQSEIAEVAEPAAPGRGGSSAMAHKRNPTLSIAARAAATRMPGFVATLLAAQDQEHERAAGAWQAEAATWPALMLCASGGLAAMVEALPLLVVFPETMQKNLALIDHSDIPEAVPILVERALRDRQTTESLNKNDR
jgi:3-carboxy-cis,cis-muconate cycloisomerase